MAWLRTNTFGGCSTRPHPCVVLKDEVNLKNIAGNEVSIFLYRFELRDNAIDFVLNEAIAEDMYPNIDEKMKPLVHACCETISRYRHLSVSNTIMAIFWLRENLRSC